MRAAGLLAQAGADVTITSRRPQQGTHLDAIRQRFGGMVRAVVLADSSQAAAVLEGAELLLNAGPPGSCLVPRDAWAKRRGLRAAADLNAVPRSASKGSR